MAVATSPRKFTSGHFAFMRAVVQGIDLRASWDRYLRTEGEHEDLRKVRSTIARMRTEFAAAARRHARPGTARLVLIDADEVHETPGLPSRWTFHDLSNGGCFMAPRGPSLGIVAPNGFDETMDAESAGIVATLYALSALSFKYPAVDVFATRFHQLRDFALEHAKAGAILEAID
jgi:hypothetical protein